MLLVALLVGGCAPSPTEAPRMPVQRLEGKAMGTTWSVTWRGAAPTPEAAQGAIEDALNTVDAAMSTWRDDSELQAVRRGRGPVEVSEETWTVVRAALDLAAATDGAFDPTVEPLMELWGFRGDRRSTPPTGKEVELARRRVDWKRVKLGRAVSGGAPTIDAQGTGLDLSAIAKGHAVDRVSWALSSLGAAHHLVEIGGEVRAQGEGPQGAWRLGVEVPDARRAPGSTFAAFLRLRNAGLATSGNYRNAYDAGGTWVVHTMDPRTGRPHETTVASATVIAPNCRTADGWATALMVLDPEAGLAAVEREPQLEAILLIGGAEGFEQRLSSGASRWID